MLIHIYSFSKAFRLTGHRVGALVADPSRLFQVEKFLDTMTICAPQLGQKAALWGLRNLGGWVAEQREEILVRRNAARAAIGACPGGRCSAAAPISPMPGTRSGSPRARWRHVWSGGLGAAAAGDDVRAGREDGGDGAAERQLRIAFANVGVPGIAQLGARLGAFAPA